MRKFLKIFSIIFLFALLAKSENPISENVFLKGDWKKNLDSAKVNKKIILLQCTADWCLPCKQMEKFSFTDKSFIDFSKKNLYCYKLDATSFDDINQLNEMKVEKYPTTIFINSDGQEIKRLVGFQSAKNLIAEADKILHPKKIILPQKNLGTKVVKHK
jgi:thiol:disulfide interchange protein